MHYAGRTALVTGASSGIGAAFARELAARRCDLVLVARRQSRLAELAEKLRSEHGVSVDVVAVDLSLPTAAAEVRRATDAMGRTVDILVNNAGFGTYGRYEEVDPARDHAQVAVNVSAVVDLTHAYLPGMVARGHGAIVNVSSAGSFQPMPYQAVYAASKAFVQSFSEALWAENRGRGIRVTACCPSATDTEYFDVLGNEDEARFGPKRPPVGVARAALRAVERNRPYVVVGLPWKITTKVPRVLPRSVMARLGERLLRPKQG
ncbi:SDR family oxidoreductase [Streptomyces sp. NBC_01136]|uniref:SDR family NAD(P)-dependent oxidoreductase n=1 Tax=unclassified Streptomyces TaxID=2593676 RepID=UPI00325682B4|nr:SDR family oxidoreductase [Streptomyces sp. NBC_01136]